MQNDGKTTVVVDNTGETFDCGAGEYILDAGLDAGLRLPHSCRGGACGTCKSQVLEGEVDHGWVQSFAMTDEEKAQGLCLICQSKPLTPTLRLRSLGEMPRADADGIKVSPLEFRAVVLASHAVTPSIREVVLAIPTGLTFRFRAGMHMEFVVPGISPNRTYSIATSPEADGTAPHGILRFFITRHAKGQASGWLHDHLGVGSAVDLAGPFGDFTLPVGLERPMLCLGGGSGLAPLLSLAERALTDGLVEPVQFVLSVRTGEEVFALDRLHALRSRFANLDYVVTVTREAPADGTDWREGRIPSLLPDMVPDLSGQACFIAGPPQFVDDCADAARALGVDAGDLFVDSFLAAAPEAALSAAC